MCRIANRIWCRGTTHRADIASTSPAPLTVWARPAGPAGMSETVSAAESRAQERMSNPLSAVPADHTTHSFPILPYSVDSVGQLMQQMHMTGLTGIEAADQSMHAVQTEVTVVNIDTDSHYRIY